MKRLISNSFLLVLASLLFVPSVFAATTGVVAATVTAQSVSISLDVTSVTYGTLATSGTKDTTASGTNTSITATNSGNVSEILTIKGADTTNWTLAGSAGTNNYVHQFCTTTCDTTPSWTALTTSDQTLAASVASSGTQVFDLKITAPSSTTFFTQQTANVTVTAAAN
ncbi:hypothetical protein M1349_00465 [Patescibacteria group bacterium]|nr:hypothetical protein [Patescibacteria group bacterium]